MKFKTIYSPQARTHFLERLKNLQADSERKWGTMTASQMLVHITEALSVILGDQTAKDQSNFMYRTLGKFFLLNVIFPRRLPTAVEFKAGKGGIPGGKFADEHKKCISLIDRMAAARPGELNQMHPMLGKMTFAELGKLTAIHLDHHFRQFGI